MDEDGDTSLQTFPTSGEKEFSRGTDPNLIYAAYYKLKNPAQQILGYVEGYFRSHGMNYTLDEIFSAKDEITHELFDTLNVKMNRYGYIITDVVARDIEPDSEVKKAMNHIVATEKEKEAQKNRATAQKATKILEAEGEARTRELQGEGIAKARAAILKGLQESVENFHAAVPEADATTLLKVILMTQYMDVIKEAATNGKNTFILPHTVGHLQSIDDAMRTALLSTK